MGIFLNLDTIIEYFFEEVVKVLQVNNNVKYLRNQHRLILVVGQHVDVSAVGNGENVGGHFRTTLASVQLGASERVHGESLVGVDGHTEETRVRL